MHPMVLRVLIFLLLALSIIVPRLIELNVIREYFNPETANEFLVAKRIAEDHELPLIGTYAGGVNLGLNRGPLYNYLLVIPFVLGNGNPYALKLLMLALSFIGIPFMFFIVLKIFGKQAAIVSTLLFAISPIMIEIAINPWSPNPIVYVVPLVIFAVYKILKKNFYYTLILGLLLGGMTSFEIAIAGRLSVIFLFFGIMFGLRKKMPWSSIFLGVGSFAVMQLPILLYDYFNNYQNIRSLYNLFFSPLSIEPDVYQISLWEKLVNLSETFLWELRSIFTFNSYLAVACFIFLLAGFLSYSKYEKQNTEKSLLTFLYMIPFLSIIFLAFYEHKIFTWWLNDLIPIICIVGGVVLAHLLQRNRFKLPVILLLAMLSFVSIKNSYHKATTMQIAPHQQIPLQKPLDFIFTDAKGEDAQIMLVTDRNNPHDYEYLEWWYKEKKYRYNASSENNVYYVLFERNPHAASEKSLPLDEGESIVFEKRIDEIYTVQKRGKAEN